MLKYTLTAAMALTCLGVGAAYAQGKPTPEGVHKTDEDRADKSNQSERRAEIAKERSQGQNGEEKSNQRRNSEQSKAVSPGQTDVLELVDQDDLCPNVGDCI